MAAFFTSRRPGGCFDRGMRMAGRAPRSRLLVLWLVAIGVWPLSATGQGAGKLPGPPSLLVDFTGATPGTWAEYAVTVGGNDEASLTARFLFLGRKPGGNLLELTVQGPGAASGELGGKVVSRMLIAANPIGLGKPITALVVQIGTRDPIEVPLDLPGLPSQKFQNPDPKKWVGKKKITVPAGTFSANLYRDPLPDSTVESWLSDAVHPLGVVKIHSTPRPNIEGPGGRPLPPVTMVLIAFGRNGKSAITKAPRPFVAEPAETR